MKSVQASQDLIFHDPKKLDEIRKLLRRPTDPRLNNEPFESGLNDAIHKMHEELREDLKDIAKTHRMEDEFEIPTNGCIETVSSLLQDKIKTGDFDVFLCHNSEDKLEVKDIGEKVKEEGILPWLDEWELRPGLPWQEALEKEIEQIKSAAVFVGKNGIGPWQQQELTVFLREFVNRKCPVIPVLLPDAPKEPKLPIFLKGMTWIDFRKNERDSIERLIWGITGKRNWIALLKAKNESINKGLALNRLGKYQKAITAFDKALEIDPDKIAWNNKGLALDNLGKYQEAITAFDKALEIDPQYKLVLNNKEITLQKLRHLHCNRTNH